MNKKSIKILNTYTESGLKDMKEIDTYVQVEKRFFKKGEFFMVNKKLPSILKDKKYNGLTYRVLFALQEKIEFNNRISTFRQAELAQELETSQANISRSLKILEGDKIITKKGHDYYFTEIYIKGAGDKK